MRSKIAGILILILLITAILPKYVYGDDEEEEDNDTITYTYGSFKQLQDEGKAKMGNTSLITNASTSFSFGAAAAGAIGSMITIPCMLVQGLMAIIVNSTPGDSGVVTIQKIVFNEYDFFNANYTEESKNIYNEAVRTSVMYAFYSVRTLALAISLVMLIYIGIRMATSTLVNSKAKYKKMLIDWCVSFIIIFIIQYIIVIAMALSDTIVEFLASLPIQSFEESLFIQVINIFNRTKGWAYVAVVIIYIIMIFYQLRFFFLYLKRFLSIGFLILIAPLITITYAIDKAGDGKSQALDTWLREFLWNVFIQPIHAMIYLVFISSAYEIFQVAPLLAAIFFAMLSRAEKIIKNILGIKKMVSMQNMSEIMPRK